MVLAVTARLRRSGVGRTTVAVRDNPATAAAYTVGGTRVKLRAFTLAGGIAGLGGSLLAGAIQTVPYSDRYFLSPDSLALVSIDDAASRKVASGWQALISRNLVKTQPGFTDAWIQDFVTGHVAAWAAPVWAGGYQTPRIPV